MNHEDLAKIEERLAVRLPQPYRDALLQGVQIDGYDPDPFFEQDPTEILIRNLELRMYARPAFAYGTWPNDQIQIGDDGCGNYYSVTSGDQQCAVRFFDHEVNEFSTIHPNLSDYFTSLTDLFKRLDARFKELESTVRPTPVARPLDTADLARAETPRQSVLNPISLAEWTSFVEADADLEMPGYMTRLNPFTNAEMRIDYPGLATMRVGDEVYEFVFYFGRITVQQPEPAIVAKLEHAAAVLKCRLLWS